MASTYLVSLGVRQTVSASRSGADMGARPVMLVEGTLPGSRARSVEACLQCDDQEAEQRTDCSTPDTARSAESAASACNEAVDGQQRCAGDHCGPGRGIDCAADQLDND